MKVDVNEALVYAELAEAALRRNDTPQAHSNADVAYNHLRRPFLPGEEGPWVTAMRAKRHQFQVRALTILVDVHVTRRIFPDGRRIATELIELEPYSESGYAALMRLQVASGDRADALRTYERARRLLGEELGVPPGPVLTAAYEAALAADTSPAVARAGRLSGLPTGMVALLFTDLVGSTALSEQLGAGVAEKVLQDHFTLLREVVAMYAGYEVKNLGDGLMVAFASSTDAVTCAVRLQQAVAAADPCLQMRVGIHVGEPTVDDGDYFGMPVAIAKRLCDSAGAGEILVSDVVRQLSDCAATYERPEAITLKGMGDPTNTWRVTQPAD